jgi:hypothetical protein
MEKHSLHVADYNLSAVRMQTTDIHHLDFHAGYIPDAAIERIFMQDAGPSCILADANQMNDGGG